MIVRNSRLRGLHGRLSIRNLRGLIAKATFLFGSLTADNTHVKADTTVITADASVY